MISIFSEPHSEIPETDCVRGQIDYNIFYIKKLADERCSITQLAKADPKGSIPTAVVNAF